jgi:hypothetical protein
LRLKLSGYEIPSHALTSIFFVVGTPTLAFNGMAQEKEGAEIMMVLNRLVEEASIAYEAVDASGNRSSGQCTITNLKFDEMTTRPRMILFSGELVQPFG